MAVFALSSVVRADYKITDRSSKKVPDWIYSASKGYLIVEGEGPSLGAARTNAEEELRKTIIATVATNIVSSSSSSMSVKMEDNEWKDSEEFRSVTEMASARLPYLSGVTLANAEDTYWERRKDKKSGRESYAITVLYPLSEAELNKMLADFHAADAEKAADLKRLREGIEGVSSTGDIDEAVATLTTLEDYFFDSTRKMESEGLKRRYQSLYKNISMTGSVEGNGLYRCRLLFNGRPFKMSGKPDVKSNCANILGVEYAPDGYSFLIRYSSEDCIEDEENYLNVALRLGSQRLNHKAFIE